MADEEHLVLGGQLRKARRAVDLDVEEVAEHLSVDPGKVVAWEEDKARPNLGQLERLAGLYGRDIDYFLRETPAPPERIQLRSEKRRALRDLSPEARLVLAAFDELCRTAYELEHVLGRVKRPQVERLLTSKPSVELAAEQRSAFGYDNKPCVKLRERLAERGVRVFELPVTPGQFSGLSYWHQVYGPCILVNEKDLPGRKNFTLAHEYAHILYRHAPSICEISEEKVSLVGDERLCNIFAVGFLLPSGPVTQDFTKRELSRQPSIQEVGRMAGKWLVSVQAMLYRLEGLSLVDKGYADLVLSSYTPRAPRIPRREGWKWTKRRKVLGDVFVSNALEAYRDGHISLGKLAHSLGVPMREALEIAESHGENRG